MRALSIKFIEDTCRQSARESLGPRASQREVEARAQVIYLFLMGFMTSPSRMVH